MIDKCEGVYLSYLVIKLSFGDWTGQDFAERYYNKDMETEETDDSFADNSGPETSYTQAAKDTREIQKTNSDMDEPVPRNDIKRPQWLFRRRSSRTDSGIAELLTDSQSEEVAPELPAIKGKLGKQIGKGYAESVVYEHGPGRVVKVTYKGKNSFRKLLKNKEDYEFFQNRLGDSVPRTQFLRTEDGAGMATNIAIQKRVNGLPLANIPPGGLRNSSQFRQALLVFFEKCIAMWEKDGRLPDLIGRKNGKAFFDRMHPEFTPNLVYDTDENKVFLVDTSARKKIFSKEAALPFRLVQRLIVRRMKNYIKDVERKVNET